MHEVATKFSARFMTSEEELAFYRERAQHLRAELHKLEAKISELTPERHSLADKITNINRILKPR